MDIILGFRDGMGWDGKSVMAATRLHLTFLHLIQTKARAHPFTNVCRSPKSRRGENIHLPWSVTWDFASERASGGCRPNSPKQMNSLPAALSRPLHPPVLDSISSLRRGHLEPADLSIHLSSLCAQEGTVMNAILGSVSAPRSLEGGSWFCGGGRWWWAERW